jgi:hypothetical protein
MQGRDHDIDRHADEIYSELKAAIEKLEQRKGKGTKWQLIEWDEKARDLDVAIFSAACGYPHRMDLTVDRQNSNPPAVTVVVNAQSRHICPSCFPCGCLCSCMGGFRDQGTNQRLIKELISMLNREGEYIEQLVHSTGSVTYSPPDGPSAALLYNTFEGQRSSHYAYED